MRSITLPSVVCQALPYFPHYLTNGMIKKLLNTKCVLIFATGLSETVLILRSIQRDTIINVHTSLCKALVILVRL